MRERKEITLPFNGGSVRFISRYTDDWRDYNKAPRLYIDLANETILENLANRRRRPYNVYKTLLHSSDLSSIISLGTLTWSQKVGCTMCPCSPGFIIDPQGVEFADGTVTNRWDAWVTLTGAPAIDSSKPARMLA